MMQTGNRLFATAMVIYALGCLVLVAYLTRHPLVGSVSPAYAVIHDFSSSTALPDFAAIEQSQERKEAFINMLLPLIEEKNQAILKTRGVLLELRTQLAEGQDLDDRQLDVLDRLRERYRVDHDMYPETAKAIDILLLRADIIPASMVLAQAALESGWGTSRFAIEAHNLFGQWCYSPGCGLVPERRAATARHEVQRFADVEQSLSAYFRNINTHNAYRQLRQLRAQLREQDGALTGSELIAGLGKYSGRGTVYINELRNLIRVNDLENWQPAIADATTPSHATPY